MCYAKISRFSSYRMRTLIAVIVKKLWKIAAQKKFPLPFKLLLHRAREKKKKTFSDKMEMKLIFPILSSFLFLSCVRDLNLKICKKFFSRQLNFSLIQKEKTRRRELSKRRKKKFADFLKYLHSIPSLPNFHTNRLLRLSLSDNYRKIMQKWIRAQRLLFGTQFH